MNARNLLGTTIGVALAAVTLVASGQSSTGGATSPAPAAATAPAAKPGATHAAHHKHAHHAASHKTTHHAANAGATSAAGGDYHAALKSCVSGPASQRDSCLDSAIARYGRS
jgi:hypothetical protein